MLLQSSAVPVAGTVLSLALFLSVTAHLAARNVLGDVRAALALTVGPGPAAVAGDGRGALAHAGGDGAGRGRRRRPPDPRAYGLDRRPVAYVTAIHAVVSVILGSVVVAGFLLFRTAPG